MNAAAALLLARQEGRVLTSLPAGIEVRFGRIENAALSLL